MNQYLKKAFIISASALLFLSVGAGVNNVQARRYHYRYHRRVNRNRYGYWKHYRKHRRTNRARVLAAKRRHDAFTRHHADLILGAIKSESHHVHHYHILVKGLDDGWIINYRTYKNLVKEAKADIQKDERQTQSSQSADTDTSPSNIISKNISEMDSEALADINRDRAKNGLPPYRESQALNQIASLRAQQYADDPNISSPHIDPNTGKRYVDEVAQQLGYGNLKLRENADLQSINDHITYYNKKVNLKNGTDLADEANNEMMNHDAFCSNGHRDNILSDGHQFGVGTVYNPLDNYYYLIEDFAK